MRWWGTGCVLVLLLVAVSSVQICMASDGEGEVPPAVLPADADPTISSAVTVTVVNVSGAVSSTTPHLISSGRCVVSDERSTTGSPVITVTAVDSSGFVEVPGYMLIILDGPLRTISDADENTSPADLSSTVYTVEAVYTVGGGGGEGTIAIAFDENVPETCEYSAAITTAAGPTMGGAQAERGVEEKGMPVLSSNSLPILPEFGGRSRYYLLDIASNTTCFWVDLVWSDPERPLTLTMYHPGGVLGTYDDESDGKEDNRIYLRISNEAGIEEGNWFLKISGSRSFTTRNYSFMTYLG